jgi:hypothetical protein
MEIDIEKTRPEFEERMTGVATKHDYKHMGTLLRRYDDGGYRVGWVDSAWIGWCSAIAAGVACCGGDE